MLVVQDTLVSQLSLLRRLVLGHLFPVTLYLLLLLTDSTYILLLLVLLALLLPLQLLDLLLELRHDAAMLVVPYHHTLLATHSQPVHLLETLVV